MEDKALDSPCKKQVSTPFLRERGAPPGTWNALKKHNYQTATSYPHGKACCVNRGVLMPNHDGQAYGVGLCVRERIFFNAPDVR